MRKIAVLGSTGSIGTSSLKVIGANPERYKVVALAAGRNIDLLARQIAAFSPRSVAVLDEGMVEPLKGLLDRHFETEVFYGEEGYARLATLEEVDTVISAIPGAAGLIPTYAAIKAGKDIALANKECMVMAGPLVMEEAKARGISIFPIDSEHSAILQCLQGHRKEDLRRIILTASGGPFREWPEEKLKAVSPEEALHHPNWNMGRKISIDSATLMNKGLETIEAKWLFDLRIDQISVIIHPQSIVHSMVEYMDGSIIAQLGIPDMVTPISYALSYPRHIGTSLPPLRLEDVGTLSFLKPDPGRFKCLDLAFRAAEEGGSMPAVLNGANEIAVDLFLKGRIGFLDIPRLIEKAMNAHRAFAVESVEQVMEVDRWARKTAGELL